MRRLPVLLLCLMTLGLAACGGDSESAADAGDGDAAKTTAQTTNGCRVVAEPTPKEDAEREAPSFRVESGKAYTAVLETNCGTLEIELDAKRSPKTASSFIGLVRDGFYDGLLFHRIPPDFVVQGGDPLGTGMGGPGYSVVEAPPEGTTYGRGVVAMAKTQVEEPGTSGSQFFIVTADQTDLGPEYAVLGKLSEGEHVLDRLAAAPTDPAQEFRPTEPMLIEKATIREP